MSLSFYDQHGLKYFQATADIDMSELYPPFLQRIPQGGHILDAGCGSGRDSRAFLAMGYRITAFDTSPVMVRLSSELIGQPTLHLAFQDLAFVSMFDGIWACASLLHVPPHDINDVLRRLATALKIGGCLYASFKIGNGRRTEGDRIFVDYTEDSFQRLLEQHHNLQLEEMWRSSDKKLGGSCDRWLNVLLSKA